MIDVFLRFAPATPLRMHLASAVLCRWLEEAEANIHCLFMRGTYPQELFPGLCEVELLEADFCWTTRNYAEERAAGEYYILADDDHLILGEHWVERAVRGIREGYGILAARSVISPERFENLDNLYVGCPAIIRKGAVDYHLLEGSPNQQDGIICAAMRKNGFQTGFIAGLDYNHLGFGFSQVEPLLWGRY
jgi:hypothetical protein